MTSDAKEKVGITPRSAIRDQIEARLGTLEVEQIASWEELEQLTGRPRVELYQLCTSARDALRRNQKMHFVTQEGEGIRRVSHAEAARVIVPRGTRKLRSTARRNTRVIRDVDLDQVPQAERITVLSHASLAAFVQVATTDKAVKALEGAQTSKALTPEEAAARLFKQLKK